MSDRRAPPMADVNPHHGGLGDHGGTPKGHGDRSDGDQGQQDPVKRDSRIRRFADAAPAILWATDPSGACVFLSRAWYIYTGLTEQSSLGFGWLEAIHPDDREQTRTTFLTASERRELFQYDYRLRRHDGSYRWHIDTGRLVSGPEGDFLGYVGSVIDIDDRKQAEGELRKSEERYRLIVEGASDYAILTTDPEGHIESWSPGAEAVFGWRAEEAIGQSSAMVFTPEDRAAGAPESERTVARREGAAPDVRWHVRKDGTCVYIDGTIRALYDDEGEVRGFLKIGQDVTERRQHELALQRLNESLQQLNETLEERVEERTRELRDHEERLRELSEALALAEQRERQRIAHVLHDDLQQILFGARVAAETGKTKRLENLLREAMQLTRLLSHELSPPTIQGDDLDDLLRWIAERKREKYGLDVEVEVASGIPVPSPSIRMLLFQLIRELLFNVAKHAGTTQARIVAGYGDGYVRVTVQDEGTGFDPEVLAEAPATAAPSGGLGLASIRDRVELVRGRMRVDSTPGRGTRVTLEVPLQA